MIEKYSNSNSNSNSNFSGSKGPGLVGAGGGRHSDGFREQEGDEWVGFNQNRDEEKELSSGGSDDSDGLNWEEEQVLKTWRVDPEGNGGSDIEEEMKRFGMFLRDIELACAAADRKGLAF